MSYAVAERPATIAEYEIFVDRQPHDTRWELVDGHILAMTNPTEDHGQIATSIGLRIRPEAQQRGCRVNIGGIRVQASDDRSGTTATIPNVTVRFGERVDRNWITDPVIVVEVLSPSTMDTDRGPKLDFYKTFPTMQDIVLVYQDQIRIEHYRRDGEGWRIDALTRLNDVLTTDGLPLSLLLADIYADTALGGA